MMDSIDYLISNLFMPVAIFNFQNKERGVYAIPVKLRASKFFKPTKSKIPELFLNSKPNFK